MVALVVVRLALAVRLGATLGVIALVFGTIMVATGIDGFCPLHALAARLTRGRRLASSTAA